MIRFFLAALLLAVPLASAGDDFAILPPAGGACTGDETSDSDGGSYSDESGYFWYSRESRSGAEACHSSDDTVDGHITSNGNEVVGVRVGYGDAWSEGRDDESTYGGYSWHNNDSSSYGTWWSSTSSRESSSTGGQEANVSTMSGSARYFDGCSSEDAWRSWASSSSGGSSRNGSSSSGSSYHASSSDEFTSTCGRTLTVESGVTSARAGRETTCTAEGSSDQAYSEQTNDGAPSGHGWHAAQFAQRCADGHFAQVGSERAEVGSRSDCTFVDSGDHWWYENANGTYDSSGSECQHRMGVFGPTALGVFIEERQTTQQYCENGGCQEESSSSRALIVEHAYTGQLVVAYLP